MGALGSKQVTMTREWYLVWLWMQPILDDDVVADRYDDFIGEQLQRSLRRYKGSRTPWPSWITWWDHPDLGCVTTSTGEIRYFGTLAEAEPKGYRGFVPIPLEWELDTVESKFDHPILFAVSGS